MPTDQELQARRDERAQAREDARDERLERDAVTIARTTPTPVTALDGLGVERIVTTTTDYEPPQVDPDPKEVERLRNLQTRLDNQKAERLSKLSGTPDSATGASVAAEALKAQESVGVPSTSAAPATGTGDSGQAEADRKAAEADAESRRQEAEAAKAKADAEAKAKADAAKGGNA